MGKENHILEMSSMWRESLYDINELQNKWLNIVYTKDSNKKILTVSYIDVFIPNLLSQNSIEGSSLDQQSLNLLHTLLATLQQNQTLPICRNEITD